VVTDDSSHSSHEVPEPAGRVAPDLLVAVSGPVETPLVVVEGELDVATSSRLRRRLDDAVDAGARDVRVDLTAVGFMDSSGLGALMAVHHRLRDRDGRITITGAAPPVRKILEITALDEVFVLAPEA
jgi:anti-sigma B factor antagonist